MMGLSQDQAARLLKQVNEVDRCNIDASQSRQLNRLFIVAGFVTTIGPTLMVLPLDDSGGKQLTEGEVIEPLSSPLVDWSLTDNISHTTSPTSVVVTVSGTYQNQVGVHSSLQRTVSQDRTTQDIL